MISIQRCALCGRKINDYNYHFGLTCLKRLCTKMKINDVTSVQDEKVLNKKIMFLCNKKGLTNNQKNMLTNRYLTLQMLNQLPSDQYTDYRNDIQKDIDIINKNTKIEDLQSFKTITLKDSAEIVRLYNKHQSVLYKIMHGELDIEQNLYFNIIRFAFSIHYNNKPYLSDMLQQFQYNLLKLGVMVLRINNFNFSADCLDNSLQETPNDMIITNGEIIQIIKNDKNFVKEINNLIQKIDSKKIDKIEDETITVNFENGDLFLSLHSVLINVNGTKNTYNKWNLTIKINDVYDFTDLREVQQYIKNDNSYGLGFVGAFANNFAIISTSCNVINEYNIEISFNIENWDV